MIWVGRRNAAGNDGFSAVTALALNRLKKSA
jgi:hypothetical protein